MNHCKLPTTAGENLKCYCPQIGKIACKLYTMVGKNIKCYCLQIGKIACKLPTIAGKYWNFNSLKYSKNYM